MCSRLEIDLQWSGHITLIVSSADNLRASVGLFSFLESSSRSCVIKQLSHGYTGHHVNSTWGSFCIQSCSKDVTQDIICSP